MERKKLNLKKFFLKKMSLNRLSIFPISTFQFWWPGADLNHRRRDFQSLALPLSYPAGLNFQCAIYNNSIIFAGRILLRPDDFEN